MRKLLFLCFVSSVLLMACSKNEPSEVLVDAEEIKSGEQSVPTVSIEDKILDTENKQNQEEKDCESSQEAYQSCLADMREAAYVSFKKSGLPKEFHGKWVDSKEQCNEDSSAFSEISARSYIEVENPCDIEGIVMFGSSNQLQLNLKCMNDFTDENAGYRERLVTLTIDNNNLEIQEEMAPGETETKNRVRCAN